jgi:hypothetical protein
VTYPDNGGMNPIEVISIVGRIVAVGVTLVVIGWFTSRRSAAQAVDTPNPIQQHLDRTGSGS